MCVGGGGGVLPGGYCPGVAIFQGRGAIARGGGLFSMRAIARGAIVRGAIVRGAIAQGGYSPGGECPKGD